MDFWYLLTEINISSRNLFSPFLDWKIEDIDKIGGCGANLRFERRGGRAQENYPRMEGGMRDWDATSVRQGVIGGHEMATEINTGTQTSLDSTLILHTIEDDHGGATCVSRLQMIGSAAMMASYVKHLHLPGDAKNTVFRYVITHPQTKLDQRRREICWLHLQQFSTDGVGSSEKSGKFLQYKLLTFRSPQLLTL